jgi:hypothetical protein
MDRISLFSLETHTGPYEKWPLKTRLFADGKDTGRVISGYVIEAQYKCFGGYLIITSYDCLFEESNTFLLLDDSYQTLATGGLGVMYDTFLLENHRALSATALELDYGDGLRYILALKPQLFGGMMLELERVVA